MNAFARAAVGLAAISFIAAATATGADRDKSWAALLEGGHVALIRHANAPPGYGGDPPGFRIEDCATQRNLDDKGRAEARALGETFRRHGVRVDRVVSSPWCRCLDTARLMDVGAVESSWALVPDTPQTASSRLDELKKIVAAWRGPGTLVLVTHAFTIRALLESYSLPKFLPLQGESVVLKPQPGTATGADFVGLIPTPH
jgi:phosphohistidine phosphatase SixA